MRAHLINISFPKWLCVGVCWSVCLCIEYMYGLLHATASVYEVIASNDENDVDSLPNDDGLMMAFFHFSVL